MSMISFWATVIYGSCHVNTLVNKPQRSLTDCNKQVLPVYFENWQRRMEPCISGIKAKKLLCLNEWVAQKKEKNWRAAHTSQFVMLLRVFAVSFICPPVLRLSAIRPIRFKANKSSNLPSDYFRPSNPFLSTVTRSSNWLIVTFLLGFKILSTLQHVCVFWLQRRSVEVFTLWLQGLKKVSGLINLPTNPPPHPPHSGGSPPVLKPFVCLGDQPHFLPLQQWCGCRWCWSSCTSACCWSAARCCLCSCVSGLGSPPPNAGASCSTLLPLSSQSWEVQLLELYLIVVFF